MTRDDRECAAVGRLSRRSERLARAAQMPDPRVGARGDDLAEAGVGGEGDLAIEGSGDVVATSQWWLPKSAARDSARAGQAGAPRPSDSLVGPLPDGNEVPTVICRMTPRWLHGSNRAKTVLRYCLGAPRERPSCRQGSGWPEEPRHADHVAPPTPAAAAGCGDGVPRCCRRGVGHRSGACVPRCPPLRDTPTDRSTAAGRSRRHTRSAVARSTANGV